MKRKISLILITTLIFSMSACGEASSEEKTDDSAVPESEEETSVTETEISPELPDIDMGGKTFMIFAERWYDYEPMDIDDLTPEDINGDIVNDTAFERQKRIEKRFNCNIEQLSYNNTDINILLNSISARDDNFQIALFRATHLNNMFSSGYLMPLDELPYLDLEAEWYDTNSLEALRMLNTTPGIVSNVTMDTNKMVGCAYFNQRMADDFGLGDIYELVNSGKWTWEKLYSFAQVVSADLNSDGEYTVDDRYGFSYISDIPVCLLQSGGASFAKFNSDGIPELTFSEEANVSKMLELWETLADTTMSFNVHGGRTDNVNRDEAGIFINGHTLVTLAGIYYAPQFRGMKDDFGIIPMLKYDEAQKDYKSPVFTSTFVITGVPVSNTDPENSGILLEELSYEGWRDILPAFYDVTLQGKITRDETSNRMLDLSFSSTCCDPGLVYDFGGLYWIISAKLVGKDGNFASSLSSVSKSVQTNIDQVIAQAESVRN